MVLASPRAVVGPVGRSSSPLRCSGSKSNSVIRPWSRGDPRALTQLVRTPDL